MKLATVLTPLSDHNLRLAAQCGVEGVVLRWPGPDPALLRTAQSRVREFGMQVAAIEGALPIKRIKTGTDHDGSEQAAFLQLVRQLGDAGISLLCWNFMPATDWVRTRPDAPERGNARVTAFDVGEAERAVSLAETGTVTPPTGLCSDDLWRALESFLEQTIPVAEAAGVTLAMHPDDPPLNEFQGWPRIMNSVAAFERLLATVPARSNRVCFCQGTFAAMGVDIPATIRRLGSGIAYVHFRDVRGTAESFVETFHDNGPTDMAAAIQALREIGFDGFLRPDHVPQLDGEEDGEPGYTMLGRLFAFGYIRGLLHGTEPR